MKHLQLLYPFTDRVSILAWKNLDRKEERLESAKWAIPKTQTFFVAQLFCDCNLLPQWIVQCPFCFSLGTFSCCLQRFQLMKGNLEAPAVAQVKSTCSRVVVLTSHESFDPWLKMLRKPTGRLQWWLVKVRDWQHPNINMGRKAPQIGLKID